MIEANLRIVGNLEIGIDPAEGAKWVAETINHARNILLIGMRDGPQTGRLYERANGIAHRASRAGQWPAVDTGNLRRNTRTRFNGLEGELGSNVKYAEYLQEDIPAPRIKARKLYNEALELAIDDRLEKLGDVIFVRFENDSSRGN